MPQLHKYASARVFIRLKAVYIHQKLRHLVFRFCLFRNVTEKLRFVLYFKAPFALDNKLMNIHYRLAFVFNNFSYTRLSLLPLKGVCLLMKYSPVVKHLTVKNILYPIKILQNKSHPVIVLSKRFYYEVTKSGNLEFLSVTT